MNYIEEQAKKLENAKSEKVEYDMMGLSKAIEDIEKVIQDTIKEIEDNMIGNS